MSENKKLDRMCMLLSTSAFCLILVGCATTPREVRAVWTQPTIPPADLSAPSGFTVTPTQAFTVARDSDMISLKHIWHIYADSHYYYVHDTFLGDSPRRAYAQAVRIDGQTGHIVRR